jgi:hypothetical protein
MGKTSVLKVLCAVVVSLALGLTTEPLLAQRGGHGGGGFHGGGGGFHGGGGYGGFHGGGGYGGFHGGGGGFHGGGGYGGFRGGSGFRGGAISSRTAFAGGFHGGGFARGHGGFVPVRPGFFPGRGFFPGPVGFFPGRFGFGGFAPFGFGWGGWGFGLSFNFGGFWGPAYAYPYPYVPGWVAPPYYYYPSPYYVPSGYAPADPGSYSASNGDYPDSSEAEYANTGYPNPESASYAGPTSQQLAETAIRQIPHARPDLRNAIRALSGMPPAARERELATGLYAGFSPDERQLVKAAVFTPAPKANARAVERAAQHEPEQHRREVQNAIRTLQAMPPAARQRQIDSGLYSSFSPSEREMLKTVSAVQTSARVTQPGM